MGLIGGSLGLALRRARPKRWRVIGLGRGKASLTLARRRGACDETFTDWRPAIRRADEIVICTPPVQIVPVTRRILPWIKPDAVISDVGSVKGPILSGWKNLKKIRGRSRGFSFVGAHPMAGSETSGIAHARADLFRGMVCAITPCPGEPASAVRRVEEIWKACGAVPVRIDARTHDRAVALTSHLPHLIASALMLAVMGKRRPIRKFVARSFLDLTRVAASDSALWADIFRMNRAALQEALRDFGGAVRRLSRATASDRLLSLTAAYRRMWPL